MPDRKITVAVGGGHELDRAARAALLSSLPGLHVISLEKEPQVLVWDVTKTDSLPASVQDSTILLITDRVDFEPLPNAIMGLFSPDESPAALGIAIRQVARGHQYLSPSLAAALLERRQSSATPTNADKDKVEQLSEREKEILNLLAQGLSNKMIASRLYLSVRTVEGHLANIYSHLGVHSRAEAMLIAVKVR